MDHPGKNIITRAVGTAPEVNIDFFDVELEEGNKILMCSDGLSNMVRDDVMQEILQASENIEESAEKMVQQANENGGKDNISVVLVEPTASGV